MSDQNIIINNNVDEMMITSNNCLCTDFKLNENTGEFYCKDCNKIDSCENRSIAQETLDCKIL